MTNSRIKLLLILFSPVFMLFGYLFVVGVMNYSGFCWAEKRWLSDEEYIRAAARDVQTGGVSYNSIEYKSGDYNFPASMGKLTEYTNYRDPESWNSYPKGGYSPKIDVMLKLQIEDFFRQYPQCCTIVSRDDPRFIREKSFLEKIYGIRAAVVEVISDVKLIHMTTKNVVTLEDYKAYVAVENCGSASQYAIID
ncbi:MAG: hypothetical protein EAZ52_05345 [Alphaproteobacteria bacterium]|nr:MAG: hypothetical protein EAZ52_05345 [Alphaproteobacteria bacterium]